MIRTKPLTRKVPLRPGTKRMKQRHRACGAPTRAQQSRQDAQRGRGCAMCRLLGFSFDGLAEGMSPCGVTRIHHCNVGDLHGNKQLGQDDTVALGDWHHDGVLMYALPTVAAMRAHFGPSYALHKRAFLEVISDNLGERSTAALQHWSETQPEARA